MIKKIIDLYFEHELIFEKLIFDDHGFLKIKYAKKI